MHLELKSRPSLINIGFKHITLAKKWVPGASPIWSLWPRVGRVNVITIYFNSICDKSRLYLFSTLILVCWVNIIVIYQFSPFKNPLKHFTEVVTKGITRGAEIVFFKPIAKCNPGRICEWRNAVFEHLPKSSARVILATFILRLPSGLPTSGLPTGGQSWGGQS